MLIQPSQKELKIGQNNPENRRSLNYARGLMKKIGLLGGSFDPVHFGHLNLAVSLKEAADLDQVFFVPAHTSPFKMQSPPPVKGLHRLEMLKRAVEGVEGFEVLDWELKRPAPSYTIDTVRRLLADASVQLHLLLAEDHIPTFLNWKESDCLIQLAPPLIGTREKKSTPLVCNFGQLIPMSSFEISSTQVRQRLSCNAYCGHMVPMSVIEYIKEHQLYT